MQSCVVLGVCKAQSPQRSSGYLRKITWQNVGLGWRVCRRFDRDGNIAGVAEGAGRVSKGKRLGMTTGSVLASLAVRGRQIC